MEIVRYSDKCIVKQEKSTKEVEAEILEFKVRRLQRLLFCG